VKATSKERLRSWKEIAGFFGTDERTVKRWAATRGLPVQRVPGGTRTPVFADVTALENWLKASQEPEQAPVLERQPLPRPPASPPSSRFFGKRLAVAALIGFALLGGGVLAVQSDAFGRFPRLGRAHQPPREAVDLYHAGMLHWEKRSPESLGRAVQYFSQALAHDPEYAEAYAGLANCYLLLREYTRMPSEQAYPLAEAAARRAISLDPKLSDAHAALAFATFYWARDFRRAEQGFERAVDLDPNSAHARHWYGTALLHTGDAAGALEQIEQAQRLDPDSLSIMADKGIVLFHAGRSAEAVRLLGQIERLEPDYLSPHAYLAVIHLTGGRDAQFLHHAGKAARLRQDAPRLALIEQAKRAHQAGGRHAMLTSLLAGQEKLYAGGQESAYALAGTYALLGNRAAALRYLATSVNRREALAMGLRIDPYLKSLRGDPAYRALSDRIGTPNAARS
jgi:tetratricopeptide (TPR) repeat protein